MHALGAPNQQAMHHERQEAATGPSPFLMFISLFSCSYSAYESYKCTNTYSFGFFCSSQTGMALWEEQGILYQKWNFKIMYLYDSTYFLMLKCSLWEFRYSVITVSVPFHVSLIKWITLWFTLCKLNHVCKNTRCSKNTRLREGVRYRKR